MLKKTKLVVILMLLLAFLPLYADVEVFAEQNIEGEIIEEQYSAIYSKWSKDGIKAAKDCSKIISPLNFNIKNEENMLGVQESQGYKRPVISLKNGDSFSFEVEVEQAGLYDVAFDYYVLNNGLIPAQCSIKVNDKFQYYEGRRIIFPVFWENETEKFPIDRFGNEIIPTQKQIKKWQNTKLEDSNKMELDSLKVCLIKGKNKFEILQNSGEILIGEIKVSSPVKLKNYKEYKDLYKDKKISSNTLIIKEAEKSSYKNDTRIRPIVSRDLEVKPYDTNKLLLNTLGGEAWSQGGQTVYYEVEVVEDGLYNIGFKVNQSLKANSNIFRTILIDDEIPFKEAEHFRFPYTNEWKTIDFGDSNGKYDIYLEKGKHTLALEVDITPYRNVIDTISGVMNEINNLDLEVRKLVGNNDDPYRDWVITDYMPNIQNQMNNMAAELNQSYEKAKKLNDGKDNTKELISFKLAIDKLNTLSKEPNKIPSKLDQLSEGAGSVGQILGDTITEFQRQPLVMDQIYLYSKDKNLPSYKVSFINASVEGIKRFFNSFVPKEKKSEVKNEKVLNVWVNRPRNYIDLMQKMADEQFTKNSDIKVDFSVMPNEQKLILANSAGTQPDLALGISTWLPYELAIRNAALNLRQFEDFDKYINRFSPGSLISMTIDDNVYGLPETQDFYVLFYRKDILDALKIPVPDTWDEVKSILPELQRYGMNFYAPIAASGGFKPFMSTAPFIYQYGGDMYSKDGMTTALNSEKSLEAIKTMTDLFTIYGLPMQVPNFYNHFRYGTIPIGIGNFGNYLKLKTAAPEIEGSWNLALHPGVKNEKGEIERWAAGSAQSAMVFNSTKYPKESWEFLKWWLSTEVQVDFGYQLETLYGQEYVWNSANLEAFKQLPWDEESKKVILEQWGFLREVPKIPGGYMVERELSNIWNKIVFDGENPRSALDESVIIMNREINRKMEEFGYIKDKRVITPYKVPTIEQVEGWVRNSNEK